MANSLSVSIVADVADLRAKLALAQADLRAFNTETRSLADQMRAAGEQGASSFGAGLERAAQNAARAKAEVASLNAEIKASSGAGGGFAALDRGFENLGGFIGAARTALEAFLAAAAVDRFASAIDGTLKLGEELEILSQKTRISIPALSDLKFAAEQNDVSFETLTAALRGLAVTTEQAIINPASKQAAAYRQLGIDTDFLKANQNNLEAILRKVADAYATGGTATQQADNAQLIFLRGGRELLPVLQQGSAGLEAMAERARAFGAELSPDMAEKLADANKGVKDFSAAWQGLENVLGARLAPAIKTTSLELANLFAGTRESEIIVYEQYLKNNEARLEEVSEAAKKAQGDFAKLWYTGEIDHYGQKIDEIKAKLADLKAEGPNLAKGLIVPLPGPLVDKASLPGGGPGDKPDVPQANPWKDLETGAGQASALEKFREGLAELRASQTESNVELLAEEAQRWAAEVNDTKLTAKEKVEAERGYFDAVRAYNQAKRTEDEAIARSDAETNIAIAKLRITEEKTQLDEDLAAHKINAQQKLDILNSFEAQQYQMERAELERRLALLENEPAEWERVYNQIQLLDEQHKQQLGANMKTYTADVKKELDEQASYWKSTLSEIESFESGLVSDILTKRQSVTADLIQLSGKLVTSEIANDLKAFTNHIFYSEAELAADKSLQAGGLLSHLIFESGKTAQTVAGTGARRVADTTESTSFLGSIGTMLARWLGLETSKTAATVSGAAAREGAFTAEQIASHASDIAFAFSEIQIQASIGAAAAFADSASLGPVGLAAAPAAATAAYMEIMGSAAGLGGGVAGLEVGAWNIPSPMLALLHPGESVVPQDFATGLRTSGALDSGGAGGGGDNYQITIQALDTQTGAQFLQRNIGAIVRSLRGAVRNGATLPSSALAGA